MADTVKSPRGDFPSARQDQFVLRFPDGLREEIKASAAANGRSMNAEIISLILGQQSLRDQFAGQAISGVIRQCATDLQFRSSGETAEQYFAMKAYAIADAMIAARKAGA